MGTQGGLRHSGLPSVSRGANCARSPHGAVRISRTLAGDQTIGVLYNFVHDGRVLNYQSGFLYESDGRLKPGLVSHVLAIQDSIARGERSYDFLAGGGGHKSRLANREHAMKWIAIGRDSPERRIEAKLRDAKRMLRTIATNFPKRSCRSVFRIWGLIPRRSVWLFRGPMGGWLVYIMRCDHCRCWPLWIVGGSTLAPTWC